MMKKSFVPGRLIPAIFLCFNYFLFPSFAFPSLFKSASTQRLVETARDHNWSINFTKLKPIDTLHIIAIRVEFNNGEKDSSVLTTGDGTFGIRKMGDIPEYRRYRDDTTYRYDRLPHDSIYFAHQFDAMRNYFRKVSHRKLSLQYSIFPAVPGEQGYHVSHTMNWYSPGVKKKLETWDEFYYRKYKGIMLFVKDAILAAQAQDSSVFGRLHYGPDSTIRDSNNVRTVFMLVHAGSSYLTDQFQDSPSDMIDIFVNKDLFSYMKDTLKITEPGIRVKGLGSSMLISEIMMCSETSNQDGLNWGIQGIMVNQLARQLGIPDLYSTSTPGIGAFCIMDVPGYSAGSGFVPPYPSAWVRAFMGWDAAAESGIGALSSARVKALTTVLDDSLHTYDPSRDTTMLMVPLNDHEYYLIENRQRNLAGDRSLFKFDTTETDAKEEFIAGFPLNINLKKAITVTQDSSRVETSTGNNDLSLPASGVLVWHIDENIIRQRIANDMVNSDSLYKGVSLMEADGVTDLGIQFQNLFSETVFDNGGAEDVYPHQTIHNGTFVIDSITPYTKPSTKANDGGQTYLKVRIGHAGRNPLTEHYSIRDYFVNDYVDTFFNVNVQWDYLVPQWPKCAAPGKFFDPVAADLDINHAGNELFVLSESGVAYAWSADSNSITYGNRSFTIDHVNLWGDTVRNADTIRYLDSLKGTVASPSVVNGSVFVPSSMRCVYVLKTLGAAALWDTVMIPDTPSTYVCCYRDSSWALGCRGGTVQFGVNKQPAATKLTLSTGSVVTAVASIRELGSTVAVIQNDGRLSLCTAGRVFADTSVPVPNGLGPYTLVTGDLDRDSSSEIVVCDSRHGLWVYKRDLSLAPGWTTEPNDWASVYHENAAKNDDRSQLPANFSPPALADINRDGRLDILVSGTNGMYAFNYKGALISGWPAYLDNRYWYQRGSILSSPVVVTGKGRVPTVLFSSPTGENATYTIVRLSSIDSVRGVIRFWASDGTIDSIWGLSYSFIDSVIKFNDSLVAPYILPGGYVDALTPGAKRPVAPVSFLPSSAGPEPLSCWPLSTGAPLTTSPMAASLDNNAIIDLVAVSSGGWVYRWKLPPEILPDSLFWPLVGFDRGRSFAYGGSQLNMLTAERDPITFHSYPNPTNGSPDAIFKYKFSGQATGVRLDIFTLTGYSVYSNTRMGTGPQNLTGSYPDWNELSVSLAKFGRGLYRCRLEATVNGKKSAKYWKMAVVK
jgi:hypothetical protein